MLSKTFLGMILISFISSAFTGNFERMSGEFATSILDAVNLCISLVGMMCFWSGLMNVFRDAGVLKYISRLLKPLMKLIYGKKRLSDETLENLSASISANFLGLGNAALPLGIETIKGFEKKNKSKGTASNESVMFAVLSTVPFQLIPSTLIALRTKYGSVNPFDVVPAIWLCSLIIIAFAVIVCKLFSHLWKGESE